MEMPFALVRHDFRSLYLTLFLSPCVSTTLLRFNDIITLHVSLLEKHGNVFYLIYIKAVFNVPFSERIYFRWISGSIWSTFSLQCYLYPVLVRRQESDPKMFLVRSCVSFGMDASLSFSQSCQEKAHVLDYTLAFIV